MDFFSVALKWFFQGGHTSFKTSPFPDFQKKVVQNKIPYPIPTPFFFGAEPFNPQGAGSYRLCGEVAREQLWRLSVPRLCLMRLERCEISRIFPSRMWKQRSTCMRCLIFRCPSCVIHDVMWRQPSIGNWRMFFFFLPAHFTSRNGPYSMMRNQVMPFLATKHTQIHRCDLILCSRNSWQWQKMIEHTFELEDIGRLNNTKFVFPNW